MRNRSFAIPLLCVLFASPAYAAVESAHSDGFVVRHEVTVPVDAKRAYEAMIRPGQWWSDAHTWSGSAANLSLDARAGGCWCEKWEGGEAEHGVVVFLKRNEQLRVRAAFGPLQEMALNGVFDLALHAAEGGTRIVATFRVNGPASANLDKLAAPVDGVIGEQVERLRALLAADATQ